MTSDEELAWLHEIVRDLRPLVGKQMDEIVSLRSDLAASNARVAELERTLERMATGFDECGRQFRDYERQHLAKTPPDRLKADTNETFGRFYEGYARIAREVLPKDNGE